jgi:hypothetical protein
MKLYNSWTTDKTISKKEFKDLNDTDMGSIDLFKTEEEAPVRTVYPPLMYELMVVGAILLLTSFIL